MLPFMPRGLSLQVSRVRRINRRCKCVILPVQLEQVHVRCEILREGLGVAHALHGRVHEARVAQIVEAGRSFFARQGCSTFSLFQFDFLDDGQRVPWRYLSPLWPESETISSGHVRSLLRTSMSSWSLSLQPSEASVAFSSSRSTRQC